MMMKMNILLLEFMNGFKIILLTNNNKNGLKKEKTCYNRQP